MASECLVNDLMPVEAGEFDHQESKDQASSINSGMANTEGSATHSSSGSTSTTSHIPPKSAEERLHQMQLAQKQAEEKRLLHMMERKQKIEDNRRRDEERRKKAMEKRRELDEQRANRLLAAEAALETASDSAQQRMTTSCYVPSGTHQLSTEGNNLTTRRSTNKTDSQHVGLRSVSSHRATTNTSPRVGSGTSAVSRRHSHLGPAFGSSTPRDICTHWGSGSSGGGGVSSGVVRSASSTPHPHAVSSTSSPRHRHTGCHIPRGVDPFSPFDRWRSCSELRIANAAACNASKKRNAVHIKGHVSSVKANSRVRSATTSSLPGRMTRSLHTFATSNTETRDSISKSNTMGSRSRSTAQTADGVENISSRDSPSMTKSVRLSTTPTDNITSKSFPNRKNTHGLSSPRQPVKSLTAVKVTNSSEESSNNPQEIGRVSEPISPSGTLDKALLPSHNRVGSEPVKFPQDATHRRTKSATKPQDEMTKSTVTFSTMDQRKSKPLPAKMLSSTNTLSRSTLSSKTPDRETSVPLESSAQPEPKTIRKMKKASASATESKAGALKATDSAPPSKEASPSLEISEGIVKEIKPPSDEGNLQNKVDPPSEDKKEEGPLSAVKEDTPSALSEEEEYRRKLAEQRRLKREAREKEEEERRRLLEEAKQRAAEERERMQKEAIRIQESEAQRKREEEERLQQEKELKMKQEEEERKLAQAREADRRRQQQLEEEAIRAADEERLARRRKVDAIMSRVNKPDSGLPGISANTSSLPVGDGGDTGSLDRRSLPPAMTTSAIYLNGFGDAPSMESSQCASNEEQPLPLTEVKESLPSAAPNPVNTDVLNTSNNIVTPQPEIKTQFKSPLLQSLLGEGRLSSKNISQLRRSSGPGGSTPSFQRNGTSPPTQTIASPSESACLNSYASDLNNTVVDNNNGIENNPSQTSQSQLDSATLPSFPVRRLLPTEPGSRFATKDGSLRTHLPTSLSAHGALSTHCSEEQNMNKENTQQITDLVKNPFPTVAWEVDASSTDIAGENTHKTSTDQTFENCTDSQLTEELNF